MTFHDEVKDCGERMDRGCEGQRMTRAEFLRQAARYSLAAVGIAACLPPVAQPEAPALRGASTLSTDDFVKEIVDGKEVLVRVGMNFPWTFVMVSAHGLQSVTVSSVLTPRARLHALRTAVRAARRGKTMAHGQRIAKLTPSNRQVSA
jgi:hypothetical protein